MNYNIITLSGCTLFYEEFVRAQQILESHGVITLLPTFFSKSRDRERWDRIPQEKKERLIPILEEIHNRKIDISDAVLVIDVGQYIRESTQKEMEYAKEQGKDVLLWSDGYLERIEQNE